eukprot:TRINITY_DN11750_c0_g1_i9.p1 TRINITY_DN11750_c0_g1~~TRINITY_DN11750_c0_g1_i9.p1  ORF type:complete len:338 (+),score=50.16 TRINITY_DN11750_c0_g1_i9:120-1016(+)
MKYPLGSVSATEATAKCKSLFGTNTQITSDMTLGQGGFFEDPTVITNYFCSVSEWKSDKIADCCLGKDNTVNSCNPLWDISAEDSMCMKNAAVKDYCTQPTNINSPECKNIIERAYKTYGATGLVPYDDAMTKFCQSNPENPACDCINSTMPLPQCLDSKCTNSTAYKTGSMRQILDNKDCPKQVCMNLIKFDKNFCSGNPDVCIQVKDVQQKNQCGTSPAVAPLPGPVSTSPSPLPPPITPVPVPPVAEPADSVPSTDNFPSDEGTNKWLDLVRNQPYVIGVMALAATGLVYVALMR